MRQTDITTELLKFIQAKLIEAAEKGKRLPHDERSVHIAAFSTQLMADVRDKKQGLIEQYLGMSETK